MSTLPLLFGPYGGGAVDRIEQFDDAGVNALWFHGFDEAAFEACARHDIASCVEFKTFRAEFNRRPELVPIGVDGKPIRYGRLVQGVCLSQQDFLDETEAHLVKGLESFQPAGIWLDYLTYAGWFEMPEPDLQESCFCAQCVDEFCTATGIDATQPEEILGKHAQAWTQHKCERIANLGKHYAQLIRQHRPEAVIGAYMCPWTPEEFDGALTRIFAQDYALLAPAIDVFTPLIYVQKSGRDAAWGKQFLKNSGAFVPPERKVQLILDVLDYPDSLIETAQSTSPSWGIQMFGGRQVFDDPEHIRIWREAVEHIQETLSTNS